MAEICESHSGFDFESIPQTAAELSVIDGDAYKPVDEDVTAESDLSEDRTVRSLAHQAAPDVIYEADEVPEVTSELLELEQIPESMYVIKLQPRCSPAQEESVPNCTNLTPDAVNELENGDLICKSLVAKDSRRTDIASSSGDGSDLPGLDITASPQIEEIVGDQDDDEGPLCDFGSNLGKSSGNAGLYADSGQGANSTCESSSVKITIKDSTPTSLIEASLEEPDSDFKMGVISISDLRYRRLDDHQYADFRDKVGVVESLDVLPEFPESAESGAEKENQHVRFLDEENGQVMYELENVPKDIDELYLVHDPEDTSEHVILFYEAGKRCDRSKSSQADCKPLPSDVTIDSTTSDDLASSRDMTSVDELNSSDNLHVDIAEFTEVSTFRCKFCDKGFTEIEQLQRHVIAHIGEVALKCSMCNEEFTSCDICRNDLMESFEKCIPMQDMERSYECDICDKHYVNSEALRSHARNHSLENLYTCGICSRGEPTSDALIAHLMTHLWAEKRAERAANEAAKQCVLDANSSPSEPPPGDNLKQSPGHQCTVCQMIFKSADGLKLHMYLHPSDEHPLKSENKAKPSSIANAALATGSPKKFRSRVGRPRKRLRPFKVQWDDNLHGADVKKEPEKEEEEDVLVNVTDDEQSSNMDVVTESAGDAIAETDCTPVTHPNVIKPESADADTKAHESAAEPDSCKTGTKQQYKCSECDRSFTYQSNLTRHNLNVHNIGKSHRCDICGEQFEVKASLRKHKLGHDSDGVQHHKCTICGHTFAREDKLNQHMLEHKSKSHACDVCGKLFSLTTTLQQHKMTHLQVEKQSPRALAKRSPAVTPKKPAAAKVATEVSSPIVTNNSSLDNSLTASPKEKTIHKCHICHKTFIRSFTLQRHLLNIHRMTTKTNFKCDYCAKEFALEVNYKKHVLLHTDGKEYVCCICGDTFGRADRLDQHMLKHNADIKPVIPVPISTLTLPAPPVHATHVTYSIQPMLTSSPGLYIDQQTGQISQGMIPHLTLAPTPSPITPLQNLIRQSLNPMGMYQQQVVQTSLSPGAAFVTSQTVQPQAQAGLPHSNFAEPTSKSDSSPLPQPGMAKSSPAHKLKSPGRTVVANSKSSSPNKQKIVIKSNTPKSISGIKPLQTMKIDPTTKKAIVSKQMKEVKVNTNASSSSRPKVVTLNTLSGDGVKTVKTLHTSDQPIKVREKPYKCSICNRRFSNVNTLRDHMVLHNAKHQHICEFCKKTFARMNELKLHLTSHTGDKVYKCHICGKEFARPGCLRAHVMIHTGEKRYECRTCKSRFTHVSTLRKHILTHTKEKPFRCEVCDQSFSQSGNMMRHMKSKHEQSPQSMQTE